MVDEFTEAAGLDYDEEFSWTVADGAVIDATSSYESLNDLQDFMRTLDSWIEIEHPATPFTPSGWFNYPRRVRFLQSSNWSTSSSPTPMPTP